MKKIKEWFEYNWQIIIGGLIIVGIIGGLIFWFFSQEGEALNVNHNLTKEANNFNITRRITVINSRTDTILLQLTGNFSLSNNDVDELIITNELEDGTYQKHYIYLNEYTLYVVEDLSGANVSKYKYELNFLPEGPGIEVTTND